jgi:NADPH2:quinone reductase
VAKAGGADHVLDYKQDPLPERVAEITGGEGVNRIVEVELTNLEPDMGLLHNGGTIAVYGMDPGNELNIPAFSTLSARNPIIRCVLVYTMPAEAKAQAVADLAKWCTHGNAQFSIARRFSLDDAAAAHEYVEAGTKIGHVVLEID